MRRGELDLRRLLDAGVDPPVLRAAGRRRAGRRIQAQALIGPCHDERPKRSKLNPMSTSSERPLQPVSVPEGWSPDSWRAYGAGQQPVYPDVATLAGVLDELRVLPPLVTSWEILSLRKQ